MHREVAIRPRKAPRRPRRLPGWALALAIALAALVVAGLNVLILLGL